MPWCLEVSPECPVQHSIYGYYPNLGANAFLLAWFSIFLVLNVLLLFRYRTWFYSIALTLGCLCEVIGYIGRILLHNNPFSDVGFQMQICCLIIGPAFNSAAIYLTLKHIVLTFGSEFSLLKPALYTYIFITGDLIALVLQAIGGGMAASAGPTQPNQQKLGTHIMLAGICWQVLTLLLFLTMVLQYIVKRRNAARKIPLSTVSRSLLYSTKFQLFTFGVASAYLAVFARCVYRIAEMAGGWGNKIMQDEPSFIALEGIMIAWAIMVQTIFHPGYFFPPMISKDINTKASIPMDLVESQATKEVAPRDEY